MNKFFSFIALDIETTGFDPTIEEIIEIGAVKYEKGNQIERFSIFIKPLKEVPVFIKQLTHITDEQLNSGLSIREGLKKLLDFLEDYPIVCHNSQFDIEFIQEKLSENQLPRIENDIYDTLTLCRIYFPFATNHKLITMTQYLDIELTNAHRAIYDAEATALVFIETIKFILDSITLDVNRVVYQLLTVTSLHSDNNLLIKSIYLYQQKNVLLTKASVRKENIKQRKNNHFENKPRKPIIPEIDEVFSQNSYFDKNFKNYEIRDGQIEMAYAVSENLKKKNIILAEAGTGVGKSLAYLIPSLIHTSQKEKKVIISTNTKNLQEQLFYKDIPLIADSVPIEFNAVLLKGRRNYICEKRWREIISGVDEITAEYEAEALLYLIVWKNFTLTGDISENSSFNLKRFAGIWRNIVADRHFCRGRKCSFFSECYLMQIRIKAEKANLLVINHHLLIADLLSENSALGKYEHLIIDEAHNLPGMASEEFGQVLSFSEINTFLSILYNSKNELAVGQLTRLKQDAVSSGISAEKKDIIKSQVEELTKFISRKKRSYKKFFEKISEIVDKNGSFRKLRVKKVSDYPKIFAKLKKIRDDWDDLLIDVKMLEDILSGINSSIFKNYEEHTDNITAALQKISEFSEIIEQLIEPDFNNFALWFSSSDTNSKQKATGSINYAPLRVGDYFNDYLYSNDISILFTSATLSLRGSFKYYKAKMGLDMVEEKLNEIIVESPFDYSKQSAALVPTMLPSPQNSEFVAKSVKLVKKIIIESEKGVMILFTSYRDLNYYYDELKDDLYAKNILLLAQGKGISRSVMLYEFKKNEKAVLLGTNSFWEGVDIPGKALSILILTKLPFLVPSEPIVEAYIELLEYEGKNSFMHYMLPNALLKYRQGFGRLIRNKTDRGLVIVLDNRVIKKFYGKYFCEILPTKTKIIQSDKQMTDFLDNWTF